MYALSVKYAIQAPGRSFSQLVSRVCWERLTTRVQLLRFVESGLGQLHNEHFHCLNQRLLGRRKLQLAQSEPSACVRQSPLTNGPYLAFSFLHHNSPLCRSAGIDGQFSLGHIVAEPRIISVSAVDQARSTLEIPTREALEGSELISFAQMQAASTTVYVCHRESIPFRLDDPTRMAEGNASDTQRHGLEKRHVDSISRRASMVSYSVYADLEQLVWRNGTRVGLPHRNELTRGNLDGAEPTVQWHDSSRGWYRGK